MRDYKEEYRKYQSSPAEIKRRAGRNAARRLMIKKGLVKKGDGKEVDHKNFNTRDNRLSNLRIMSASKNRARKPPNYKS